MGQVAPIRSTGTDRSHVGMAASAIESCAAPRHDVIDNGSPVRASVAMAIDGSTRTVAGARGKAAS